MSEIKSETQKEYTLSPQETALLCGDLSRLTETQRAELVMRVCDSVGLNPLTRPFQYIELNKRLVLYATKDCTEQLRKIHSVSLTISSREQIGDAYVVTAQAKMPSGRVDESTGAVATKGLGGDSLANAMMKTETKAKRRVTLSICGLGLLDESEIDTIQGARVLPPVSLPASAATLPAATAAPTVAQARTSHFLENEEEIATMANLLSIGKKLGKLNHAVQDDVRHAGGEILVVHAGYLKELAEKNPRGGAQAHHAVAVAAKSEALNSPTVLLTTTQPAVDGEAGDDDYEDEGPGDYVPYEDRGPNGAQIAAMTIGAKPDAPESEKLAAVMKLMTHAGFEREYPKLEEKMRVCAEVVGRSISAYSQLSPEDCVKVLEFLKSTEQPQGDLMASESEITQLQIELKDAKFVEFLKTSKAYKAASESGNNQAESLRAARLAFAGHVLGRAVETFKDCTSEEVKKLFAKFKELKNK